PAHMAVVGAHRAAEHEARLVLVHRRRQLVPHAGAADVENVAALHEEAADPARIGPLLVNDAENLTAHDGLKYGGRRRAEQVPPGQPVSYVTRERARRWSRPPHRRSVLPSEGP